MGSIMDVIKEVVARHTRVIEAFDSLTAPKKVTQCNAAIAPIPRYFHINSRGIFFKAFLTLKKNRKLIPAIKTLYHTNSTADRLIRSPNIAVSPNKSTAICSSR